MLDRGLRRRFDPLVEREARAAAERARRATCRAATCATCRRSRSTRRPRATSTTRSAPSGSRTASIRVWVHIADVAAHVPPGSAVDREAYRRATSVYVPGKVEPMLPEALSNDACSLVPHQDRLAVTVELDLDGADVVRTAFHRSLIRSDARLDYPRVDRIFAGAERAEEPWAAPLEAARAAARRARRRARRARGARRRVGRAGVRLLARRARHRARAERADRVAHADRAPDDRRQRGGRRAARGAQAAGALPRPRAARPGARRAPRRAARRARRADAAAAGADVAAAGGRRWSARSRGWSTRTCAAPAAGARR